MQDAEAIVHQLFETPDGRRDPYPQYHRLRAVAPIHRSRTLNAWVLTRYDDIWAVLRDPRLGKAYASTMEHRFGADWRRHPSLADHEHSLINVHGADHTRLRRLVSKAFTRRTIDELRPAIERMVDELLEPLAAAAAATSSTRSPFRFRSRSSGSCSASPKPIGRGSATSCAPARRHSRRYRPPRSSPPPTQPIWRSSPTSRA
jgi:cytochrome P450